MTVIHFNKSQISDADARKIAARAYSAGAVNVERVSPDEGMPYVMVERRDGTSQHVARRPDGTWYAGDDETLRTLAEGRDLEAVLESL